jgi:hypothetical protein
MVAYGAPVVIPCVNDPGNVGAMGYFPRKIRVPFCLRTLLDIDQGLLPLRWRRGATSSILTRRCDSPLDRPDIVMTFPDIAADHMTSRIAFEGTGEIRVVNIELAIEDRDRDALAPVSFLPARGIGPDKAEHI